MQVRKQFLIDQIERKLEKYKTINHIISEYNNLAQKFSFFLSWHINLCGLLNAKAIFVVEK